MKVIVLLMALTCVICQKPVAEDASVIYEKGKKSINQFLIELGRSEDDLADNGDLVHRSCRKRVPSDMVSQKSKRTRSLDSVGETESVRAHVRTCTCTTSLTFVKRQTNGSLTTHQISAQSVQPFPRYLKGVRTCARAAIPHHRLT